MKIEGFSVHPFETAIYPKEKTLGELTKVEFVSQGVEKNGVCDML